MEPNWLPPQTTEELVKRYPDLVESLVLRVLYKLQHGRLHATDQDKDIAQQMYLILDKPSGKSQLSLLQQFDLSRCPLTPENGWKKWLFTHVITKRTLNILKEEKRKGRFHQPIHEDADVDEPSTTIPLATGDDPLECFLREETVTTGSFRLNEFCTMIRFMGDLQEEEKTTLISIAQLCTQGAPKDEIETYIGGGPAGLTLAADLLHQFWVFYDKCYCVDYA